MNVPMNAVGHTGTWVKENPGIVGKRVLSAVAGTVGEDASKHARDLHEGQSMVEVVARKGMKREPVRSATETQFRARERQSAERRRAGGRDERSEPTANLSGIAQELGMTVSQLVAELDKDGITVQRLFAERGIAPPPGTIADLTM